MSSRFKRCKTCGTTNASDFAPRKSVICKNCEASNSVIPEVKPALSLQQQLPLPVSEETFENLNTTIITEETPVTFASFSEETSEVLKNSDVSELKEVRETYASVISEEAFQNILQKFHEVETNYQLLKAEVDKLGRLKKMFPRMFPEDDAK
jgi:hypothetical protein